MIRWDALNTGGVQNALATGLQLGQIARQQQQENALMQQRERQIRLAEQEAAARQAAVTRESQAKGLNEFLPMIRKAAESPEAWRSIYDANVRAGRDMSGIPQEYDPEFAQALIVLADAQTKGIDLTEKARNVMLSLPPEQRDTNNPEFIKRMAREDEKIITWQPGGGVAGIDPLTGQSRIIVQPGGDPAPQPQQAPRPAPQPQQSPNIPVVPEDIFRNDVNSLGLQGAINFAVSKGLAVPITGDAEFAALPSGAAFVGPDGLMRRKP